MRDNQWLKMKLDNIWTEYFPDIPRSNDVRIYFGRKCRGRLGSIRLVDDKVSEIRLNGLLKDGSIPEFVCDAVIAHELTHYAHGFGSNRPQLYKYPHRGGIVAREMIRRGLGDVHYNAKDWINSNWLSFYEEKKRK